MKAFEEGREALSEWLGAQPKNFYDADPLLQILVEGAGLGDRIEALEAFGAVAAGPLDQRSSRTTDPGTCQFWTRTTVSAGTSPVSHTIRATTEPGSSSTRAG